MPIILSTYAVLVLALTGAEYQRRKALQVWLKPICALLFIAIAVLGGALYWDYGRWILWGLAACAVGDILLLSRGNPLRFKLGMAAFALGHIFYIFAFMVFDEGAGLSWLAILPILAGIGFLVWIKPKLPKDMVIPVAIYALIIIVMTVRALGLPNLIIPIAAILFAISDMFVARDRFVNDAPANALVITPLYFGAQALFAMSAAIGS